MQLLHIKFLKNVKSHWKSIEAIKGLVNAHLNMDIKDEAGRNNHKGK